MVKLRDRLYIFDGLKHPRDEDVWTIRGRAGRPGVLGGYERDREARFDGREESDEEVLVAQSDGGRSN